MNQNILAPFWRGENSQRYSTRGARDKIHYRKDKMKQSMLMDFALQQLLRLDDSVPSTPAKRRWKKLDSA
jgi:hypothetical protein